MTSGRIIAAPRAAGAQSGISTGALLACAVCLLALPSAVLAFTASFDVAVPDAAAPGAGDSLGGESPGLRLARGMPLQSLARGQLYPFTPASNPNRPDRSVTVAVRIDPQAMQAIVARGAAPAAGADGAANLGLAKSGFSLGVARGYRTFAPGIAPAPAARHNDPPDLAHYAVAGPASRGDPRFSSRVVIDDRPPAGRAPRTFAGDKDEQVDVSGSYRLTRNLDVTAGVRYSQDRERLLPLTDGRQDSQAVYVGTQIHF